uniref:Zinc finger protein 628-like n=1 Tax=Poecilia latipinna TaxID=48699 RepID=A0A3B3U5K7_9TELE
MSPLLLRAFVNERLTAVLGEILEVFEGAIAKYEEEASNSKQEIDRLQALLLELQSQRTGVFTAADPTGRTGSKTRTAPLSRSDKAEEPARFSWYLSMSLLPASASKCCLLHYCSFVSPRDSDSSHLNSPGADYRCSLCGDCFPSSHLLMNHAFQAHSRDVGVLCAVCGGTFESAESLEVHRRSHENSKCCPLCGKLFRSTTSLKEHMAGHAGLKLHRCHVCGKECRRKGDLKIHMRIHTGEKPFCCSLCCKSFTHSGHLKKHMRSHTGERPYRCDVCGRGFLQSGHLKSHLGTHAQKK